jgi:hypothetical protein
MKLSLRYLDTCYPDYFQGFGGEVFAVMVDSKTRTAEVLEGLQGAISAWSGYMPDAQADEIHYEQLHASASALFWDTDKRKTWNKHAGDECYAYFGVIVESDD